MQVPPQAGQKDLVVITNPIFLVEHAKTWWKTFHLYYYLPSQFHARLYKIDTIPIPDSY